MRYLLETWIPLQVRLLCPIAFVSRFFTEFPGTGKKKRMQGAYVPSGLQDVWKRDRAKKAEYKRARKEKRRLAMLDPFLPSNSRAKNKGKAVASAEDDHDHSDDYDHEGEEKKPSPIIDLVSLTAQIRIFIHDIGRQTMVLPPMETASRALVHKIAAAFNLKSKSAGKGSNRHTTLIRTSRTGIGISEVKITAILKRSGAEGPFARVHDRKSGNAGGRGPARHKEGDIVGQKAAKIDEHNVGFKLLQRMGYGVCDSYCYRGVLVFMHCLLAGKKANTLVSQEGSPHRSQR